MYKIYVNDLCIFDDTSSDLGLKVTDAKLSMEDNSAGSLEMTLPISNVGYGSIVKMRSHIVVYRNDTKVWGGRPVTETEDFYKNRTYHCEGELAYLNDTFQPLEEYSGLTLQQFLQVILHVHNNKCNGDEVFTSYSNMPYQGKTKVLVDGRTVCSRLSTFDLYESTDEAPEDPDPTIDDGRGEASIVTGHLDKRIYLGTVTMHDDANNDYRYTNYQSTMDVLGGLLERLGGHIRVRTHNNKLYLDYLRDYPSTNVRQTVELAKNLLDYAKDYDMSNLCTVLLPLGAKKSGEDIVGDEKKTHWNRKSYMDSVGRIRYGKYFHRTKKLECEKKSNWLEYDSISGTTVEKEVENTLTFNGEQVAGEVYVAFYNKLGNFISAATASATDQNPKDNGTQCFVNFNVTIPEEAASVSFGYYYGGSINIREFRAIFESNYKTWIYTNSTLDKDGQSVCVANEKIDNYGQFVAPVDESYVVSNKIRVKEKQSYFITSRLNNGYGMYCCYDVEDRVLGGGPSRATDGVGFTDWEKNKVETPVGAHYIIVGAKTGVSLNPVVYGNGKTTSDYETTPDEYITIEKVNSGDLYLRNQSLIDTYGWIEKQAVWEDIETPEELLSRANEYLQYAQFGDVSLEVTAYDLSLNRHNLASPIRLLDKVRVVSSPHGIDLTLPVTKLEIPLLDPVNATYTLGSEDGTQTLTGNSTVSDLEIFKRLSEVPKPSNILSSARANATEILNMESEGYISNDGNEFLVMDYPDKEHCTRLWRWNINGLGYSSTGYAGTYGTAITMDGSIVADRITTGYMHADRIRGGTLTLGGYDDVDGKFYMKNANGDNFVKMTKDGAEMIVKITQPGRWLWTTASQTVQRGYGLVEYDKGCITGYTARIKAELDENPDVNWFNNYSFSFDDVSDKSAITRLNMIANEDRALIESTGTRLHSNKFFIASCSTPDSVWSYNTPRLELHQNNSGSLVFGVVSSGFVGLRYDSADSAFTSEDASTYVNPLTLTIRNDSYPSSVSAGIGVGGVSLVSKRGPISLEGNTIYAKGNDFVFTKGSTPLTNLSGTFPIVFTITDGGNSWTYGEITVVNGFITSVSGLSSSGSGGSGDSGGGFVSD